MMMMSENQFNPACVVCGKTEPPPPGWTCRTANARALCHTATITPPTTMKEWNDPARRLQQAVAGALATKFDSSLVSACAPAEPQKVQPPNEDSYASLLEAWNKVRAEAHAISGGRGIGDLLKAVHDYATLATSAPEIDTNLLHDLLERLNGQYRAALAVGYCPSSGPYRAALSKAAKASAALSACFDALATNAPAERDEQPEYTEAEVDFLVEKLEGIATSAPSEPAPLRKFVEHCLTLEGGMVSGNLLKYEAEKVLAEAAALQSTPAVLQPEAPAEPSVSDKLHEAICHAVSIMNNSFDIARSAEGREAKDILRRALLDYAENPPAEVKERRELSNEEILKIWAELLKADAEGSLVRFARAIIAKSKEKAS